MKPTEHLAFQRRLNKETHTLTLTVPPDTDKLPLAERIHIYLAVFESGCSCTQPPIGNGKAEECPECVRAFVDAVKGAVDDEIAANPLKAMRELTSWAAGEEREPHAAATYCGQSINAGEIEPLPIRDEEGYALLSCGGTQILLSYTALHLIHGWLASGTHGYDAVRDSGAILRALAAIAAEAAEGNRP